MHGSRFCRGAFAHKYLGRGNASVYRRKPRHIPALLALTVSLRVLPGICVNAAVRAPELAELSRLTLSLSVGAERPPEQKTPPQIRTLHILPKEQPQPAPAEPISFTAAEADGLSVAGNSGKEFDKAALLCRPNDVSVTSDEPAVLIVHAHTSEAYTQSAGWTYRETDPLRTAEQEYSVVRVGKEIAKVLTEKGIPTLHDTSVNDDPNYNASYSLCGKRTRTMLENNPSVRVVLDVHRDAAEDAQGRQTGEVIRVGEEDSARLMLVVGTDAGGREHPNWQENLSLALKLQALGERRVPGLFRPIDLRRECFNQQLSPGALLVEVGAAGNTLPEALTAARLFAEVLAELMGAKSEE